MSKHTITRKLFYPQNETFIKKILDTYITPEISDLVLHYLVLYNTEAASNQHVIILSNGMLAAARE